MEDAKVAPPGVGSAWARAAADAPLPVGHQRRVDVTTSRLQDAPVYHLMVVVVHAADCRRR